MVKGGWICSPNGGRQQARKSAGGDDKRRAPARPGQRVLYGEQDFVAVPIPSKRFHDNVSECDESRDSCASVAQHSRSLHSVSA
jgi:hypothetical protein